MANPIITLDSVTKKFGSFVAVDNISLAVKQGEVIGFVGENGAGKTTTINMLLGFTSPSKGEVEVFGRVMRPTNAHKAHRYIGYASGDMALPDHMTGEQYIKFVMAQTPGKHAKRYEELIKAFKPQLEKKIATLSRGNKQKIALVAAFVTNPKLIVLDEPTSGLDPVMQDVFLDTIREVSRNGATVFMSSHYLQEVAEVSTRVLLMKHGKIMEDLAAERLAQQGGKVVTLVTRHKTTLPKENVVEPIIRHENKRYEASFGYTGELPTLIKWLGGVTGIIDVTITDRTLEHEFRTIYETEGENE